MSFTRALPLSVPIIPDETATSLASRLAHRNGTPRLISFCTDLGIDYFRLSNGDVDEVRHVAVLAGQDADILQMGTPSLSEQDWFLLGEETIKFTVFQRTKPQICPMCLKEARQNSVAPFAYQLGIWQLTSVRTCHKHGCYLQELPKAPSGNDHFDIASLALGANLISPSFPDPKDLELERYLLRRIAGQKGSGWIDTLPIHVAAQTCEFFGLLLLKGPKSKRHETSPSEWLKAGRIGFSYLRHGPQALIEKMDELEQNRPDDSSLYIARYGVFFEWLRDRDTDPHFDELRDLVRKFIFETFPVPKGGQVLGQQNPKRHKYTFDSLAKEKRLNKAQLGYMLLDLGYVKRCEGSSHFAPIGYIPAEIGDDVAGKLKALRTPAQTAKNMGISKPILDALTQNGVIETYFKHPQAVPVYHPSVIAEYWHKLRDTFEPYAEMEKRGKPMAIRDAARACKMPLWQALALILRHPIPVTKRSRYHKGFEELRIIASDLTDVLAKVQRQVTPVRVAAKALGTDAEGINTLMAAGKLVEQHPEENDGHTRDRLVYRENLKDLLESCD